MLDLQGSNRPVTEEEIKTIMDSFNISVPKALVDFYAVSNGGFCERNTFFIDDDGYKINEFLPFGIGADSIEGTYKDVFIKNDEMPDNLVPFAVDAGGDYFCFDSSKSGFGRIFFFESEYYDDPDRSMVYLSESFSDFIDKLEFDR